MATSARVVLLVAVCMLSAVCGCKTQTARELQVEEFRLKQQAAAQEARKANKKAVSDQDKRALELKIKRLRLEAARARGKKIEQVQQLLSAGGNEAVIEMVNEIFAQNELAIAEEKAEQARKWKTFSRFCVQKFCTTLLLLMFEETSNMIVMN